MYKVLIIDDEEPLREAINILGDWEALGVDEVLEATNGQAGLELMREKPVNIALVDMKMPEMNGLDLLRTAEKEFPNILLIVISGYDDFAYTRQAIQSKAIDYLLKPVNRTDLNTALRKAISLLETKRARDNEFINRNIALNMSLPKLKEKLYLSIIDRSVKNPSSETLSPVIGMHLGAYRYAAGVLRLLNAEQVLKDRFRGDRGLMQFAITNVLNDSGAGDFEAFSFADPKAEREVIAILAAKGSHPEEAAFQSLHHIRKSVSVLKDLFGIVCVSGMGTPYGEVLELAESYEEAKAALNGIDLLSLKAGTVAVFDPGEGNAKEGASVTGRIPQIRSSLESGNVSHARSILAELTRKWRDGGYFGLGEAERTIHEFIILLGDLGAGPEAQADRQRGARERLAKAGIGRDFTAFDEFELLLGRMLDLFAAEIGRSLSGDRNTVLENIKDYIDNHYFEDIKISMFTDKYFLSREYLMKLFKGQFGYGIHEYVQKVRMDKAKGLLSDPALKIQDISEMLGYKDKNYFSKAFRNYYECSPSEFRQQLSEEGE